MFALVSAIVINRNRKDDLYNCIQSIRDQTYPYISTLVIDNNSTDGSYYDIKLPDNMGVTIPTNMGVEYQRGEYILLVDNDAVLDPNFVQNALTLMQKDCTIGVVQGKVFDRDGHDFGYEVYGSSLSPSVQQYMGTFYACACLIRYECWKEVGGYNPIYFAYYQEPDFAGKVMKRGWKILYSPKCKATHYFSPNQRSNKVMLFYLTRNHFLFVWEHLPLSLALFQSVKWFVWSIVRGWKHPFTLLHAYGSVGRRIWTSLKNREVCNDELFIRPWKKVLRE